MWRTTKAAVEAVRHGYISIHVPRVEDDGEKKMTTYERVKFQSTSPVWRTTYALSDKVEQYKFQSTSPVWRTTQIELAGIVFTEFQSTSPVWRTTNAERHI